MSNQYTDAISSVLNILKDYDTDQMFPTYGFGGRLPGNAVGDSASHCFALNGDIYKPVCHGINGVLQAYYNSLTKVQLAGPTYFAQIIEYINGVAK